MIHKDTYERVTFKEYGRSKTIYLRGPREHRTVLGDLLIGIEVNKRGDEIRGRSFDERKRMIALTEITKRVPVVLDK